MVKLINDDHLEMPRVQTLPEVESAQRLYGCKDVVGIIQLTATEVQLAKGSIVQHCAKCSKALFEYFATMRNEQEAKGRICSRSLR